jgi:hypothetical protein
VPDAASVPLAVAVARCRDGSRCLPRHRCSGTSATDSTGNGNTGTLQSTAGWAATGKNGAHALSLTGASNSFVDIPTAVIDTSQSYSVSAWVKLNSITGTFQTVASIDGTAISPFYLQLSAAGTFNFTVSDSDSTGSATILVTGGAPVVGTWYHLVGVHDNVANTVTFYLNGVSQGSTAFNAPWKAAGHTTIGRAKWDGNPVDFVNGTIDEVHFYSRLLTQAELTALAS